MLSIAKLFFAGRIYVKLGSSLPESSARYGKKDEENEPLVRRKSPFAKSSRFAGCMAQ